MTTSSSIRVAHFDDLHLHFRDGTVLTDTTRAVASHTRYALAMPNLQPPVTTAALAKAYHERLMATVPTPELRREFTPLMTLYLTNDTTPEQIDEAKATGLVYACKLYPAGATTHSAHGVSLHDETKLRALAPTFAAMAKHGMLLLIHGEVTDQQVDIFDRESAFLTRYLPMLVREHPQLKIVLEHITTREAVEFVERAPANVAATITAHHLLYNRNHIFAGGLNPHNYCLPILKSEEHRVALTRAATSGSPRFFAGTDSAPHAVNRKCFDGCAGCYTAYAALELYTQAFAQADALDKLEAFVCRFGAAFYGLPVETTASAGGIELVRESWTVPASLPFGEDQVVPFMAGKTLNWKIVGKTY